MHFHRFLDKLVILIQIWSYFYGLAVLGSKDVIIKKLSNFNVLAGVD